MIEPQPRCGPGPPGTLALRTVVLTAVMAMAAPTVLCGQEVQPWVGLHWGQFEPRANRPNQHGVVDYKFRKISRTESGVRVTYFQVWNPNEEPVRIFFWPASSLRAKISYVGGEYGGLEFDTGRGDRPPAEYDMLGHATFTMRIELSADEVYGPARGLYYWTRPLRDEPLPAHRRLRSQPEIRQVEAIVVTILEPFEASGTAPTGVQELATLLQQFQDTMRAEQLAASEASQAREREAQRLAQEEAERERRAEELAARPRAQQEEEARQREQAERAREAQEAQAAQAAQAAAAARLEVALDEFGGVWQFQSARCAYPSTVEFSSGGTGRLHLADCTARCNPGQEAWFDWTLQSGKIQVTWTRSRFCGQEQPDSEMIGRTDITDYAVTRDQLEWVGRTWSRK